MFILTRSAEKAAYTQIEGQPGAARAALGTVRGGWDVRGRARRDRPAHPGLRLPRDRPARRRARQRGPVAPRARLLDAERKKVGPRPAQRADHAIQCGNDEGQVPLPKRRARSRGSSRPSPSRRSQRSTSGSRPSAASRLPIPKGVDPKRARPDRKGKGR